MATANKSTNITFDGKQFGSAQTSTFDAIIKTQITLPALVAAQTNGTLGTRTDADTGVVTLSTGHGISTSDVVDVYWSGGVRYGMTATVSGNDVTVDGGAGDDLPTVASTITAVVVQTDIDPLEIDGDAGNFFAVVYENASDTGAKAHIDLQDSGDLTIAEIDLSHASANGGLSNTNVVDIENGDTNTITGNPITHGAASHDSTSAGTLWILFGYDSTP